MIMLYIFFFIFTKHCNRLLVILKKDTVKSFKNKFNEIKIIIYSIICSTYLNESDDSESESDDSEENKYDESEYSDEYE